MAAETVIQLSSSLYMETQAGGLLPCILHHNHVPCALWPAWLPTEFLEASWLGQKSSASWAQLSRRGAAAWTLCMRLGLDSAHASFTMVGASADLFVFPTSNTIRASGCALSGSRYPSPPFF